MNQYKFTQRMVLLVLLTLPLAVFAGQYPQVLMDAVAAAKKATPVVTPEQLVAAMDDPAIWIIDVREPEEYAAGHIRSAINIPRGLIEFKIWENVGHPGKTDMDQKMYLYCKAGGRCALAARAPSWAKVRIMIPFT